ncbi:MAG: tetratricopeptide repeat protein [Bacteroidales bacterium]|nr:tetratricopeptide repeat protein [Bacteroidales bacterium]
MTTINKLLALTILSLVALFSASQTTHAQVNTNRMMQVGRNALYFEDYVLSIQYFNRVIIVKPYLADPYYYRAIAKFYLDDLTGCEADCNVAIDINPFLIGAYNLRGITHLRQDKPAAARDDFEKGLSYEPENVNMLLNLGIANINLEEYDKAIQQYDKLLTIDKRNVPAILYRGIAYVEKGDTITALAEFERATKINAYSPEAFTYLGMIRYQKGDFQAALKCYDRLAEIRPKDPFVYVNRAITKYNLDDLRGCMADLDEAIRLDPKNKLAFQNRGLLRAEAGDLNQAAEDFSRALAIDPSDDITLFNRAIVYGQLGMPSRALQDLNIIIAKHPDFGTAYAQRAIAKRQLGDNKGAEEDYYTAVTFEQEKSKRQPSAQQTSDADKADKPKREKKSSRGKNDDDMKKYDQMVVVADFGDTDDKLRQENKETIRGRVQDRDIAIDLEPAFSLSFFNADTLLPNAPYYSPSVVKFNAAGISDLKMVVTNRDVAADDVSARVFTMIAGVNQRLEADPWDASLYILRGTLYSVVMNYNSAITDLSAAILKDPGNVVALFNRAATRYKMVETIRDMDYEAAAPFDGALDAARNIRQEVTFLDYDLVMQDLQKVAELEPENEFAYFNMSLVFCQRKEFEQALQQLDKAIGIYDQFAEAYFNRGIIKLYLGKEEEGVADLSRAGELGMFKAYNVIKRFRAKS